jgi:PAS domain S-box-containing protein
MKRFSLSHIPLWAQGAVSLMAALALFWSLIFYDLHRLYEQTLVGSQVNAQNLVLAFAEEVKSSVNSIDLTLIDLRDRWQMPGVDFADAVQKRQAYLAADVGFQVAIIDASGLLRFSSANPQATGMNLSDREHFRVHVNQPQDQLFVSKPVLGRVSNRWSIQFTRPIGGPGGEFAGVIVLSIAPEYFSRFLDTIHLGKGGATTVLHPSGEVLARSPKPELALGKAMKQTVWNDPARDNGWYRAPSEIDGVERMYAWRTLPKAGLAVTVGQSIETILAPYHAQRRIYLLGGLGVSALLLLFSYVLLRSLQQRARDTVALAASQARWKFALEGAGDGVWDLDLTNQQVTLSPRWKALLGYQEAEVGNRMEDWTGRIHPDDLPSFRQAFEAHLDGKSPGYFSEHRLRCKDGDWKWMMERGMVVSRTPDGKAVRMVGTATDISERKNAERRDRERQQSLEETRKALQQAQKLEALGRLTGGIAHDFNNVLQTLTMGIDVALMTSDSPKVKTTLEASRRAVERGVELTRQLLVFGRAQDAHLKVVDLHEQIGGMLSLLQGALPSFIDFQLQLQEDLWAVEIDPLQFELALLNLAMNARDAMPGGGVFCIEGRNDVVVHAGDELAPGEYVRLLISDTGEGMTPEVLAKAVDPFFTTKEVGKGSGMGLAQVYGFVKQMNGVLKLRSEPQRGLEVSIHLPRAKTSQAEKEHAQPVHARPAARRNQSILFVDDDPLIRQTVHPALEAHGYHVVSANDGEQAVALLESGHKFDLVFSDVVMPGKIDGIRLSEIVRAQYQDLKIVLTTGYSERRVTLPDVRVLPKPYQIGQVIDALDETLQQAEEHPGA